MEKDADQNVNLSAREQSSRFKVAKDRVSILCGNAKEDFMVKPMMLYNSLNQHVLKNKNKHVLPMYWRVKRKAWVTSELFMDWFHNCFVPQVERYLAGKNLSFKVLMLLDNASGHPTDLNGAHPNVEVMFLPPNTTSLIQPLDQGVISTFKTDYTWRTSFSSFCKVTCTVFV